MFGLVRSTKDDVDMDLNGDNTANCAVDVRLRLAVRFFPICASS